MALLSNRQVYFYATAQVRNKRLRTHSFWDLDKQVVEALISKLTKTLTGRTKKGVAGVSEAVPVTDIPRRLLPKELVEAQDSLDKSNGITDGYRYWRTGHRVPKPLPDDC